MVFLLILFSVFCTLIVLMWLQEGIALLLGKKRFGPVPTWTDEAARREVRARTYEVWRGVYHLLGSAAVFCANVTFAVGLLGFGKANEAAYVDAVLVMSGAVMLLGVISAALYRASAPKEASIKSFLEHRYRTPVLF